MIASGSPVEHAGEPAAQRRGVVLVAVLRPAPRRRSASRAAPPAAATDRSASTFVPCCWLIWPGMPAPCSRSVSIWTRLPSPMQALVVLGEHDLVGHRRQVDLVGLLVQVVLLRRGPRGRRSRGCRRACRASWPCCGVSLGVSSERVKSSSAPSSERSSWPCPWPCPTSPAADLHQREELVEDLVEHLLVAPVLDQRDAQGGLAAAPCRAASPARGRSTMASSTSGVEMRTAAQPQQPDEPVDGVLHQRPPSRESGRARARGRRTARCARRRVRDVEWAAARSQRPLAAQARAEAAGAPFRGHLRRLRRARRRPAGCCRRCCAEPARACPSPPAPRGRRPRPRRRSGSAPRRVVVHGEWPSWPCPWPCP